MRKKTIEKEKYEEVFPETLSSSHVNGVIKTKRLPRNGKLWNVDNEEITRNLQKRITQSSGGKWRNMIKQRLQKLKDSQRRLLMNNKLTRLAQTLQALHLPVRWLESLRIPHSSPACSSMPSELLSRGKELLAISYFIVNEAKLKI